MQLDYQESLNYSTMLHRCKCLLGMTFEELMEEVEEERRKSHILEVYILYINIYIYLLVY